MNTSDLSLFIRIVETGSITESAKQLGITTPAASSALKRLEKQLDMQLLIRTTRQLRITPQGEKFLFHCRQALETLEQGVISAHEMQGNVRGELRFSVSSDLGRNIVFPWVDEMMDKHPSLSIDLNVSDTLSDFFLDQVDVALRYGKPEDSTMVSFHIATINRITCASPSYLSQYGEPSHPEDLRQHNCLLYRLDGRLFNNWEYSNNSGSYRIKVSSNRVSNDTDIVRRWAIAGKGIAYRSQVDISSDLRNGKLIQLLSDFQSPPVELYLLCPGRKQVTPAVIAFREMLREKCAHMINAG
ncbi:LysR family transcriptional regulator [Neptunomonas antarctica]|uniref:Transcriptional regulator, LysR family n=1 Tax=Neptunomonas antarctica TaxID=619304 RepID=A0A1N7NEK1_9GAMM|nr:LysR family transcriptional regulator [Neptunomonas antarctica]SIS96698.1 transcriptional regulator, LysR family [Neptunomonas antarctica]